MVNNPFPAASEPSEPLIIQHFSLRIFAGVLVMLLGVVALIVFNVLALVLLGGNLVFHLFGIVVFLVLSGWWGWALGNIIMARFSDQPVLVITHESIQDHSLAPAAGRLRWDEIERIEVDTYFGQPVLTITPTALFAYLARQQPVTRVLMWTQLVLWGAPICINTTHLPISSETLLDAIPPSHSREPRPR
jgi:hypothetical protein